MMALCASSGLHAVVPHARSEGPCPTVRAFCSAAPVIRQAARTATSQARQNKLRATRTRLVVAAAAADAVEAETSSSADDNTYEVLLPKPLGLRFQRGNDSAAYVVRSDPKLGSTDDQVEVGDKVVMVSASFGTDKWQAKNFGQVMYAIKTRNGDVYLKLEKKFGDLTALEEEELSDVEKNFRTERAGGNYGAGTKELQTRNYIGRKEAERKRRELFDDALQKYRSGKTMEALIDFENVLSMEPKRFIGDNFSRVTQIFRVTQYNIACCYSSMDQVDAGLEALESCMDAGFEDFNKIRKDPSLAALRKSDKFKPLMDRYDEPIINENAVKALKSLFSFGKKD